MLTCRTIAVVADVFRLRVVLHPVFSFCYDVVTDVFDVERVFSLMLCAGCVHVVTVCSALVCAIATRVGAADTTQFMKKQMIAERMRRAEFITAEGSKTAMRLQSEGSKMAKFNIGVAEQESTRKRSEGEAEVCFRCLA